MMKAMYRGAPDGFDADKSFEESFAGVLKVSDDQFKGKSCEYWNPLFRVDKRAEILNTFLSRPCFLVR